MLNRYSKYMQLIRITALVIRFVQNCKLSKQQCERVIGSLSVHELNVSREFWIRNIQIEACCSELKNLKSNLSVHRSSCLVKLNPFIDPNGILRVGGRLANAPIKYNTKFPIVLPPSSTFTRLLFKYEHLRLLHAGPHALLSYIQINYWPIRGRNIASRTVHHCIQYFRAKPRSITPFMAPLPRQRTTIEGPFSRCGVDFCGPMMIRSGIRRVKSVKAYISVFVGLVTRAIHLELVSSLTSDAFLATLTRFMSRRGQCKHLFSDNGTNFVGANRNSGIFPKQKKLLHCVCHSKMPRERRANIGRRTRHASQQQVYSRNLREERQNIIRENDRLRHRVSTRRSLASYNRLAFQYDPTANYSDDENFDIGRMTTICRYCNALKFKRETVGLCCASGKVKLDPLLTPPQPLKTLFDGSDPDSSHFLQHILEYNNCFRMTSFGANIIREGGFMPTCKVKDTKKNNVNTFLYIKK
ncbi:hypothetical protein QTP88_000194 [Uroleucon formosanum]